MTDITMARYGGFGPDDRFGPDRVTYEEAHRREWNRIHPGMPVPPIGRNRRGNLPGINTEIPGTGVSRSARSRYNKSLRKSHPTKEETVAPRSKPAAPPVEPEETEETDLSTYAEKTVTPAAQAFAEWITDETGYEVDERSVYLAMSLRRKFQHDEATRTRIAEIREERKPEKPEPEEKAPAAKRGAAKGVTSTSTTAKAPARGRAAAKPAAPARGRSRSAAKPAAAAAASGEAPF